MAISTTTGINGEEVKKDVCMIELVSYPDVIEPEYTSCCDETCFYYFDNIKSVYKIDKTATNFKVFLVDKKTFTTYELDSSNYIIEVYEYNNTYYLYLSLFSPGIYYTYGKGGFSYYVTYTNVAGDMIMPGELDFFLSENIEYNHIQFTSSLEGAVGEYFFNNKDFYLRVAGNVSKNEVSVEKEEVVFENGYRELVNTSYNEGYTLQLCNLSKKMLLYLKKYILVGNTVTIHNLNKNSEYFTDTFTIAGDAGYTVNFGKEHGYYISDIKINLLTKKIKKLC